MDLFLTLLWGIVMGMFINDATCTYLQNLKRDMDELKGKTPMAVISVGTLVATSVGKGATSLKFAPNIVYTEKHLFEADGIKTRIIIQMEREDREPVKAEDGGY